MGLQLEHETVRPLRLHLLVLAPQSHVEGVGAILRDHEWSAAHRVKLGKESAECVLAIDVGSPHPDVIPAAGRQPRLDELHPARQTISSLPWRAAAARSRVVRMGSRVGASAGAWADSGGA